MTKDGWIPVDIALPFMDCDVFVSVHVRGYWYDGECIEYDITKYGRFNADFLEFQHRNHCPINCKDKRVTAWQPIPEPYKEKTND